MTRLEWNQQLKGYAAADNKKAVIQIVNTVVPYMLLLVGAMLVFNSQIKGLMPVFAIGAGFFMVRTFILFHDCTHDSFVDSKKWNFILGHVFGILTFSPYLAWKKDHGIHHGAVGNLDRRGKGDVWTLTVDEYLQKPIYIKALYRLFRHPLFLFGVAPFFLFVVIHRIPHLKSTKAELKSYAVTNIGLFLFAVVFSLLFGWTTFIIVQSTVLFIAAGVGVWLFYVQHQFEEVYWENNDEYDSVKAALSGSTYYKLPAVFEWLSGYIGYHHIHHLNARIPNYHLKQCYQDIHELSRVKTVTFIQSIPLAFLQLYDNQKKKLISFRRLARG